MAKRAGVTFHGLDTFQDELETLSQDLVNEAEFILVDAATEARDAIRAAYPGRKGTLRRGVVLRPSRGTLLTGYTLVQTAPHGWIYEHGTTTRYTDAGAHRGFMTGTPTFEPIAKVYQRAAVSQIVDRLYAHGASRVEVDAEE